PIENMMRCFDSKNTKCLETPTLKELAEIYENSSKEADELDAFMNKVFEASGALFLMSINYLVPSTFVSGIQRDGPKRTSDSVTDPKDLKKIPLEKC
ncbi:hypothetical protein OS493_038296, partial [Desmophyllum pertusum]